MKAPLRSLARFVAELIRAQHRDQLMLHAGALAYTTLLSLAATLGWRDALATECGTYLP